jgi:predicted exporter
LSLRKLLPLLWAVVVFSILAYDGYLWFEKRIVPVTDILALLPAQERDPVLGQALNQIIAAAQQRLVVLLGAPDWKDARRAADSFTAVLAPHADVVQVSAAIPNETQSDWLEQLAPHRLLLLTARDDAALQGGSTEYWTDAALRTLYSPFGGVKIGAWRDDPFGLFGGWVQARGQETPVRPRDGRLFVSDGRLEYVVLPMTLKVAAFSMAGQEMLIPLLAQAEQAAVQAVPQVEIVQMGVALNAAAESARARADMSKIGTGSIVGIVLLMGLAFHSLNPIVWVVLSIAIGLAGALAICWLIFGQLHLLTFVFGATLIGVAQDYGIYFLCQRFAPHAPPDSWHLMKRLVPPLVLTLVTTVVGYMSLALTPFPGLRQMAVFSIAGLVIAWLTVLFWFPAMARAGRFKHAAVMKRYAASLEYWPIAGRNRMTLWSAIIFSGFVLVGWLKLDVQDDIRALQNPPKKILEDQIAGSKLLDAPAPAQFYLVRGDTPEAVLQREEILKQRLDPLAENRQISGYHAVSNWVPSLRKQEMRRNLIEQKLLGDNGALAALAARLGQDEQWIKLARQHLVASAAPILPENFLNHPASEPWRHLWLGRLGAEYASIVGLRGVSKGSLPELGRAAGGLDGVQWVDQIAEISSVLRTYRQYVGWLVAASFVGVYGLLYLRYGRASWRALAPTAIAIAGTLAVFGLAGHHLQLFHMLALMLLLGIGVDYGIFFQEQDATPRNQSAWVAVGLSAVSTLLSFGLLGLSSTPALRAFGITMASGIPIVWLTAPCFATKQHVNEAGPEEVVEIVT